MTKDDRVLFTKKLMEIRDSLQGTGGPLAVLDTNSAAILVATEAMLALLETTEEVPTKTTVVASGTVAAGSKSVTLVTSADFVGTILGDSAKAGATYTYGVSHMSNTVGAIAYTMSAGSIEILKMT